jgi:hypothetical protein
MAWTGTTLAQFGHTDALPHNRSPIPLVKITLKACFQHLLPCVMKLPHYRAGGHPAARSDLCYLQPAQAKT